MMHFPALFQYTAYFRKIFRQQFSKFLDFHPPQFMIIFLVIDHKFRISPYFPCFSTFPPCFAKIIISPYFEKFPSCCRKVHLLFTYFMSISSPPPLTMMHLCITQCTYWTPLLDGALRPEVLFSAPMSP